MIFRAFTRNSDVANNYYGMLMPVGEEAPRSECLCICRQQAPYYGNAVAAQLSTYRLTISATLRKWPRGKLTTETCQRPDLQVGDPKEQNARTMARTCCACGLGCWRLCSISGREKNNSALPYVCAVGIGSSDRTSDVEGCSSQGK